jgi:HTH-type transcriptional regulator/antitoxin HigA
MPANQYLPDEVSPPGETLLEVLDAREIALDELAERMFQPRETVNAIVDGKAEITLRIAQQFEEILNVPARFWNHRECLYREHLERAEREP